VNLISSLQQQWLVNTKTATFLIWPAEEQGEKQFESGATSFGTRACAFLFIYGSRISSDQTFLHETSRMARPVNSPRAVRLS